MRLPVQEKSSASQLTSAWQCCRSRHRPGPGLLEGPGPPGGGRGPGASDSAWSPAGPPAGQGARPAGGTHRALGGAEAGGTELVMGIHDHNQLMEINILLDNVLHIVDRKSVSISYEKYNLNFIYSYYNGCI